ncbi:hypothetical protein PV325_005220 [Microctonus aethiopoides]|nr:hypothetical protein PV325_005220 [Microctonus aethiopoides]
MNYPATRNPLGSRSPGCCYHTWNPHLMHIYPSCDKCFRPLLTLQHSSTLLSTCIHASHLSLCHDDQQRSLSADTTPIPLNRFNWQSSSSCIPSTNFRYRTHPPLNSSRYSSLTQTPIATATTSTSTSENIPFESSSSSSSQLKIIKPPILDITQRWIGEETKRSLPLHVYKYYLACIKQYHRKHLKVII